ncbi:MAG: LLM class flavin-dependent oxidoreductase, partial [Gammaproteobacteria bacterium]|nr:LLM class flavin-dependent oxidoreductase [Gammaproteobacteria bacterium]
DGSRARADAAGFESVWTTEFFNAHGLVRLAAVATATKRVKLGTGIAYAFMRTPMLAASAAMDIDELSGGRMVLGLGSGTRSMNENWYSMPFDAAPAPRMKDAIGLIRAAFAAQKGGGLNYEGPHYKVRIPQFSRPGAPRPSIPVAVAAVNKGMIRAAAAVADGLVGHPVFTRKYITEVVKPALDGSKCELLPYVITSIANDRAQARNEARMQIGFYYTTRLYHSILEPHGWQGIGETIANAFKKGDFAAMAAAVPDEMVDQIAITGRPDEVRDQLSQWQGLAEHVLFYSPSVGIKAERVAENMDAIIDTFKTGAH